MARIHVTLSNPTSSLKKGNLLLCWGKNLSLFLVLRVILSSFSYNLKILLPKKNRCVIHTRAHFFSSLTSSSHHLNVGWDPAWVLRLGCKWNVSRHTDFRVLFVPWVIPGNVQSSHRTPSLGSPQLLADGWGRCCCCTGVICNSVFTGSSTGGIAQLLTPISTGLHLYGPDSFHYWRTAGQQERTCLVIAGQERQVPVDGDCQRMRFLVK